MRPALFLLSTLVLTACGNDSGTTVMRGENGEKVTLATDGNATTSVDVTNDKGERAVAISTSEGAVWPATAPPYAAAYPGATLTSSITTSANGNSGSVLVFETPDAPAKIIAHYKDLATKAGLAEATSITSGTSMMFGATDKTTGREFLVQASPTDGKTQASITFASKNAG